MDSDSKYIAYLAEKPYEYTIAKSDIAIKLLKLFDDRARDIKNIKIQDFFSRFTNKDLELLINTLEKVKMIKRTKITSKTLFSLTDKGRNFLDKYNEIKSNYNLSD